MCVNATLDPDAPTIYTHIRMHLILTKLDVLVTMYYNFALSFWLTSILFVHILHVIVTMYYKMKVQEVLFT